MIHYTKDYPGGVCRSCYSRFVRVANKQGSEHAGEFAYATVNGGTAKYHVSCAQLVQRDLTAREPDHDAFGVTIRKPGAD